MHAKHADDDPDDLVGAVYNDEGTKGIIYQQGITCRVEGLAGAVAGIPPHGVEYMLEELEIPLEGWK
jgi:hypothetical protein